MIEQSNTEKKLIEILTEARAQLAKIDGQEAALITAELRAIEAAIWAGKEVFQMHMQLSQHCTKAMFEYIKDMENKGLVM